MLNPLIGVSTDFTHLREFFLTYPVPTRGKDSNRKATCWKTSVMSLLCQSDIIVIIVASQRIQDLMEAFSFKYKNAVSKKKSHLCEDGIEDSVPRDYRLTSLGKPSDAKR